MQRFFSHVLWEAMSLFTATVLPFSIILMLSACTSPAKQSVSKSDVYGEALAGGRKGELERLLRDKLSIWQGVRYRFGGESSRGVDCSAFVMKVYEELFGIPLPRTSAEQAVLGYRVSEAEIEAGDLVFSKPHRIRITWGSILVLESLSTPPLRLGLPLRTCVLGTGTDTFGPPSGSRSCDKRHSRSVRGFWAQLGYR